jgi:replicative DNA helicase
VTAIDLTPPPGRFDDDAANDFGDAPPLPPHDLEAERSALGNVLYDPERFPELRDLKPEHFYSEANRQTFAALASMRDDGTPITLVTLAERLRATGRLAQVGGSAALVELVGLTAVLSVGQLAAHVAIVLEKSRARRAAAIFERGAALVRAGQDPGATIAEAVEDLRGLAAPTSANRPAPTAEDPLRGLESLGAVAVVGAKRLRELAGVKPHYVWVAIAVAGTIVLIAAGPGEGKTTLLFLLLAARANIGEPVHVLGRLVEPAPLGAFIVLIEGEHSESSAARKLLRSVALVRLDEESLDRVILVARKAVKLGSAEWEDVVRLVAAGLVSDIAIDTVARVAPSNADSEEEQTAIFELVAQAIDAAPDEARKPTCWANAHTRKNGRTGDVSDVAGSVQRTGQADSVLMLEGEKVDGRTVATKVVFAKLREEPDDYPLPVTFSIADDEVRVSTLDELDDGRPLETRIVEAIKVRPKTANALAETLRRSTADVQTAITNLFASRLIETTYTTVRGQSRKAFTLRKNTAQISPDSIPDDLSDRTIPDAYRTDA